MGMLDENTSPETKDYIIYDLSRRLDMQIVGKRPDSLLL